MSISSIMESTSESLKEARILVQIYAPVSGQFQKQQIANYKEAIQESKKLLKSRVKADQHRGESVFYSAERHYRSFAHGQHATALATSLFIYQFAIFDAFIGRLLHEIYSQKPELVNRIEKSLTIKDIRGFKSVKEVKEYLIGKEIDSLRRDSYSAQFSTMENKFEITTLRKYDNWPVFVEGSQRRHLFTHCDGIVSQQYRTAVVDAGGKPEFKVGDKVDLDPQYFMKTNRVITETILKLSLVLWRKFWPDAKAEQETELNDRILSSIEDNQYSLAISLGEFANEYRISEEMTRRMIAINLAQAYKWKGDQAKCADTLDREDWSACTNEFKLCVNVLRDDFEAACELMRKIGKSTELMDKTSYLTWPIFKKFTEEECFKAQYKKIYRQEYLTARATTASKEQKQVSKPTKKKTAKKKTAKKKATKKS